MTTIYEDVMIEREKQKAYNYDEKHDDSHVNGELAKAAASYILFDAPGFIDGQSCAAVASHIWPFEDGFGPRSQRDNLIRASALLFAEIERIDRRDSHAD